MEHLFKKWTFVFLVHLPHFRSEGDDALRCGLRSELTMATDILLYA